MTFCRRSRSTLTRAGRAHANPPSPPRPPHARPPPAHRPPLKPGLRAASPSPALWAGTIPTSPATSTASCSRTTTTTRTRCSSCPSPPRPSTRTTARSPRSSSSTAAARRTSSSAPSHTSSATPRTAPASAPRCTPTASSRATRRAPPTPTPMRHPPAPRSRTAATRRRPTARMRECGPPPALLRCTDYLSPPPPPPASVTPMVSRIPVMTPARARPDRRPAWTLLLAAYPFPAPPLSSYYIIPRCIDCSPRCPRFPLSLSPLPLPLPRPPTNFYCIFFIVFYFLCSYDCTSCVFRPTFSFLFAPKLQLRLPPVRCGLGLVWFRWSKIAAAVSLQAYTVQLRRAGGPRPVCFGLGARPRWMGLYRWFMAGWIPS